MRVGGEGEGGWWRGEMMVWSILGLVLYRSFARIFRLAHAEWSGTRRFASPKIMSQSCECAT